MSDMAALYRIFNAEGDLLYVGISTNVAVRLYQHGREKSWWTQIARVDVQQFSTRAEAAFAEAKAIGEENPRHNIAKSTTLSADELERRRRDREEAQALHEAERLRTYRVSVSCGNCGASGAVDILRATPIPGEPCRHCGCKSLKLNKLSAMPRTLAVPSEASV